MQASAYIPVIHSDRLCKPLGEHRAVPMGKGSIAVYGAKMRILLQQKETGLYFKDIESWSRNSSEAMDFLSSTAAIDFCVSNKLKGVQLVLKFEEHQYDIVLPVVTTHPPRGERPERPDRPAAAT